MKICQSASKSPREKISLSPGDSRMKRAAREETGVRLILKCLKFSDVFRGADLPHLDSEFQIQILYKLFSFPESLLIHTQKPTQVLSFEQCQYYSLSPLGIRCSIFDNAQATPPLPGLLFNTVFFSKKCHLALELLNLHSGNWN